ncbi:MAG: methyltransferase domain-containing protein [Cytophagales bacterium]|nr:MAG: methyltransferase domain-containing protein [Cytophagales bacterium]
MASLAKTYDTQKLLGQVYTPPFIVSKILDEIGFDSPTVLGQTILDPACGDGRFLEEIAKRIISLSPAAQLAENLSYLHGWDIDAEAVSLCIGNLEKLIAPFSISVSWNIKVCDSITQLPNNEFMSIGKNKKFDFIVGNPPYIRIQHLDEQTRKFVQQNYQFCQSGSTDIYIAFYELCYQLLADDGICGLITPNTFFYTETGKALRDFLVQNKAIKKITNYADIQVFDNATTYSAILIFGKQDHPHFVFEQASSKLAFASRQIAWTEVETQKFWQLSAKKPTNTQGTKLKDICQIHVGITTLCDKVYIFPIERIDEQYAWANTRLKGKIKIETALLKPIVKGSVLKSSEDEIKEYVLFPYQKNKGKHQIISEENLKKYPLTYQYLLSVKEELDKRDNGQKNKVAWYAFGRSQGLDTSFGKKIIFSPMNLKPNFIWHENEESSLYSGYCIKYNGDVAWLLSVLNSQRFADFIAVSSRDFRGGWKAYNKKIVGEFVVEISK